MAITKREWVLLSVGIVIGVSLSFFRPSNTRMGMDAAIAPRPSINIALDNPSTPPPNSPTVVTPSDAYFSTEIEFNPKITLQAGAQTGAQVSPSASSHSAAPELNEDLVRTLREAAPGSHISIKWDPKTGIQEILVEAPSSPKDTKARSKKSASAAAQPQEGDCSCSAE